MKILQQRSEHEHTLISQIKKNFVNQLISRQQTFFSKYQPQVVTHSLVVHQQPYQAPALQQSYQAPATQQPTQPSFLELDSGLDVPIFNTSDDPIASLNKAMAFLSITFASCFPQTNNHLRTSSNPRNQATIQDGRGANRNGAAGQARVVKCYNCQEEEDNGDTFTPVQASQEIPSPAAFQTDDLDVFYSDCDDVPSTKAFLMANLSSYNSDVLSERTGLFGLPIYNPISIKTTSIHSEPVFKEGNPRELLPIIGTDTPYLLDGYGVLVFKIDIVEQARALKPLDNALDYSCKYTQRIQELLVCVCASCPSSKRVSEKLVAVTPMNRTRNVRFAESSETSKDKTQKQVKPQEKQTTNNSVSPSIRVSSSTEASVSKPRSNTKKDRISQISSSNKNINKVDHPRIATSSLNNMNRVSKTVCSTNVKHSILNVNYELIYTTCHECMFDAIHDQCVSNYLNDVNARVKSKSMTSRSAKRKKKKM
ncbi:hypothetical protein Tco_0155116 [Tanacetum coccineum]